jgi:hypothetical protein
MKFSFVLIVSLFLNATSYGKCVLSNEQCSGCGCKGGPGYREIATQKCVGFKQLDKICGNPVSNGLCIFENAPGTGQNRECALGLPKKEPENK